MIVATCTCMLCSSTSRLRNWLSQKFSISRTSKSGQIISWKWCSTVALISKGEKNTQNFIASTQIPSHSSTHLHYPQFPAQTRSVWCICKAGSDWSAPTGSSHPRGALSSPPVECFRWNVAMATRDWLEHPTLWGNLPRCDGLDWVWVDSAKSSVGPCLLLDQGAKKWEVRAIINHV